MARSRNIKPAIMDNEELAALPALTRLFSLMNPANAGLFEFRVAKAVKGAAK